MVRHLLARGRPSKVALGFEELVNEALSLEDLGMLPGIAVEVVVRRRALAADEGGFASVGT